MFEAEFWVAVAFVMFLGVVVYFGGHRQLLQGIDRRRQMIEEELAQARRLREEAQALVEQYRRKQKAAESEAEAIIAGGRAEAERLAQDAGTRLDELVARRTKMAEAKIAQAEVQAVADVRAAAADAAIAAATRILRDTTKGKIADELITRGIGEVKSKLN